MGFVDANIGHLSIHAKMFGDKGSFSYECNPETFVSEKNMKLNNLLIIHFQLLEKGKKLLLWKIEKLMI